MGAQDRFRLQRCRHARRVSATMALVATTERAPAAGATSFAVKARDPVLDAEVAALLAARQQEWRSPLADPPPYNVMVGVRRGNREFQAVLLLHKARRRGVWARLDKNRTPKWMRGAPDAWRALEGSPVPARTVDAEPPAFEKFLRKPAASVSQPVERGVWWLDATCVRYSRSGAVTPREVEGRVSRALMTCRAAKLESPKGGGSNSEWIARQIDRVEREMGLKTYDNWHSRFRPTARDLSDCADVLGWIRGLWLFDERYYVVLNMRAMDPPYSWQQIAESELFKCRAAKVQEMHRRSIRFATAHANNVTSVHAAA